MNTKKKGSKLRNRFLVIYSRMESLGSVKKKNGEDIKVEHKQLQGGKQVVEKCSLGFSGGSQERCSGRDTEHSM